MSPTQQTFESADASDATSLAILAGIARTRPDAATAQERRTPRERPIALNSTDLRSVLTAVDPTLRGTGGAQRP